MVGETEHMKGKLGGDWRKPERRNRAKNKGYREGRGWKKGAWKRGL